MSEVQTHRVAADGGFPNSPLPLLVQPSALPPDPAALEAAFAANGWTGAWRNGIYTFHHFHSTAHEVLGIAAGQVTVAFGGPHGRELTLRAGDVVVIPAGVAHCNRGQSADLLVVGAYPEGTGADLLRGHAAELARAQRAIAALPRPDRDPVLGTGAGLPRLWTPVPP